MTRARDLADSADKDISGTLTVDDPTASGEALIGTSTSPSSSDVKLAINSSGGGFAQFNFNGGAGSAIGSPAALPLSTQQQVILVLMFIQKECVSHQVGTLKQQAHHRFA